MPLSSNNDMSHLKSAIISPPYSRLPIAQVDTLLSNPLGFSMDCPTEPPVPEKPYIHILSVDVLIEIFSIVFDEQNHKREDSMPLQYRLSLVCRKWREMIITTPLFWNNIFLYPNLEFDPTLFFERSQPALLHIHFDTTLNWGLDMTTRLTAVIAANFSRIRTFVVVAWDPSAMRELLSKMKEHEPTNLTTLKIFTTFASNLYPGGLSHDHSIDITKTKHLDLTGFPAEGLLSTYPPTNLTFLAVDRLDVDIQTFQALFDNCPSLATLVIRQFGSRSGFNPGCPAPLNAPFLRHLAINLNSDHTGDCNCSFPFLSAQNLESLELVYLWSALNTHHQAIFNHLKEFSNLHKLRIRSHAMWLDDNVSFLSSLPATTNLEIIEFPRAAPAQQNLLYVLNLANVRSITIDLFPPRKPRMSMNLQNFYDLLHVNAPTLRCPVSLRSDSPEEWLASGHLHEILGDMFTLLPASAAAEKGSLDAYVDLQSFSGDPLLWQELEDDFEALAADTEYDFEEYDGFGEYDEDYFEHSMVGDIDDDDDFDEDEWYSGNQNGPYDDEQDELDPDDYDI